MTIESKGFVATDGDVATVTKGIIEAIHTAEGGRGSYLRMLIGTTQHELGLEPRKRSTKASKLDADGIAAQVAALTAVHERFYAIVTKIASDAIPASKGKATELNRRTNFARTAMSVVRTWIRAGGDLASLAPRTATKASLAVERATAVKPASARALKGKAEAQSKGLMATLMGLADTDKAAAIDEMQLVLGQITTQLLSMGVVSTKDASQAFAEHRPLRIGKQLFVPTATQVIPTAGRVLS